MNKKVLLLGCAASLASLNASSAWAQDGAGDAAASGVGSDIIVTARRTEERLVDVPVAVTALSGQELVSRRVDTFENLRFAAPALQVSPSPFGNAVPVFTIRAQRSAESIITLDPAVGVYFAEQVQVRTHGLNAAMYDLASVEVLKGPQGTLFGRNTTGGAVLINPARPKHDLEAMVQLEAGNYNHMQGTAVFNLPVSDTLAVRFAGRVTRRDGYMKHSLGGTDPAFLHVIPQARRANDNETESARISVLWEPSSTFSNYIVANLFHEDDKSMAYVFSALRPGSGAAGVPALKAAFFRQCPGADPVTFECSVSDRADFWSAEYNRQPFNKIKSWSVNDVATLELGAVTIKNILGYRKVSSFIGFDYDSTPITFFESQNAFSSSQWSEELQASGQATDRLKYIAGVYYFHEKGSDNQRSILGGRARCNCGVGTNTSISAYAQFDYNLTDALSFTFGGRYTSDKRQLTAHNQISPPGTLSPLTCRIVGANGLPLPIDQCSKDFSKTFRSPTWLASVNYKINSDTLVYLAHRRGYRAGGWNLRGNAIAEQRPFNPEYVYDVELGLKTELLDRRLRINAAAYQQWYKGIQRNLSRLINGVLASPTINAGSAKVKGFELDVNAVPVEWFELGGSLAYTDAKYTKFMNDGNDLTANRFAQSPKLTWTATARVHLPIDESAGQITFGANYYHRSKAYVTDLNTGVFGSTIYTEPPIRGYGVLDLTADWRNVMGGPVDLGVFVKNAGKTKYYTGGGGVYGSIGIQYQGVGDPRQIGASLTFHFGG